MLTVPATSPVIIAMTTGSEDDNFRERLFQRFDLSLSQASLYFF